MAWLLGVKGVESAAKGTPRPRTANNAGWVLLPLPWTEGRYTVTDIILDRIMYDPKAAMDAAALHHPNKLVPIPFPAACVPEPQTARVNYLMPGSALPKADGVIVTWTVAEKEALFDVLTPTAPEYTYAHLFDTFAPDLTGRSPAKEAGCLGTYRIAGCAGKTYLLFHSNLHVSTDGPKLPLQSLFNQIIDETNCERIITTGTAGGIGANVQLGDVTVARQCHFNCQHEFKNASFANDFYSTTLTLPKTLDINLLNSMLAANWSMLVPEVTRPWRFDALSDIETTDFFAFDTSDDHFGLRAYDPQATAVEMDDAVLGMVIANRLACGIAITILVRDP